MIVSLQHLPTAGRSDTASAKLEQQFTDLAPALSNRQAKLEAQRCLYCYDAPCTRICPTEIDVAGFIRNIAHDNINGAAKVILQQNIMGGSCSRVCPTEILCEDACVRNHGAEKEPIKIGLLQRHALDNMSFASHPFERAASTGKRVAVVGAGPAGLSCAHQLAMLGHDVVVFEKQAKAGGLNEYGIAKYKLTNDFAQKEVEFLLQIGGIEIRHGMSLGSNLSLAQLQQEYAAVFLGLGLATSRALGLTGEDAPGLLPAIDYIAELRQTSDLSQLPVPPRAIVIGAGNTAIDMAVQIKRLGAQEVTLVYRRGTQEMSATWHEQEIARLNQVRIVTWAKPEQIMLDNDGRVAGMRFEKTHLVGEKLQGTGEFFELAAEAVFKAIGQTMDASLAHDATGNTLTRAGDKIEVDAHYRTSLRGVYAGGDCISMGQDLTVQAVQDGKLAARAIDQDLKGA
ncbi:MAG: NAD(P)-dependent oxidoreductase [Burkholderiales bacterium]|nr:NAD(P)-dependent oxidoreductase [Burkholderiales bacterium]